MEPSTLQPAESTSVGADAVRLLQRLIRFDTEMSSEQLNALLRGDRQLLSRVG